MKRVRCAVYTRKSTEDGLEQEFNSLDAQREACEAYILSQRHEGWDLVSKGYDDGGFSGGSLERPGLKALLADIDNALVDVIVVYKVDRLTRSLADFAKIVEQLDAHEASFVSVTQAFNTTTSMGRLTLNVLLSFAQFEREVTGERIRDKIAASKKKGLWMGGPVPLGYEVVERKLVPEPAEAERVRTIMRRYVASTSATALLAELNAEGIRTKVQRRTSGPHRGGIPFRRGSLFYLLKNPVYRGMIVHRGQAYPGEHPAIVDEDLWAAVQARLAVKAPPRKRDTNSPQDALLKGLLTDPGGRPMVPTFTCKGTRRYRYYETRRDLAICGEPEATRFAMHQLDRHIVAQLELLLADEHRLRRLSAVKDGAGLHRMFAKASAWFAKAEAGQAEAVAGLVKSIWIASDHIELAIKPAALGIDIGEDCLRYRTELPAKLPFREAKVRIDAQSDVTSSCDRSLVRLLQDAAEARAMIMASPGISLHRLAEREKRCRKQLARLLKLSWLSPRLVETIIDGKHPARLTRKLLLEAALPVDWSQQEKLFGLSA